MGIKNKYSIYDLTIISLLAALGIVVKPAVYSIEHIFTTPVHIPGGAAAGGFYMMWLLIGYGITEKKGTCTLMGIIQSFIALSLGISGGYGLFTLVLYSFPGAAIDIFYSFYKGSLNPYIYFLGGVIANLTGTFLSSHFYFNLPFVPMMLCLSMAALSGGIGGIFAYKIGGYLVKINMISKRRGNYNEK
jgi:hypothetical protein